MVEQWARKRDEMVTSAASRMSTAAVIQPDPKMFAAKALIARPLRKKESTYPWQFDAFICSTSAPQARGEAVGGTPVYERLPEGRVAVRVCLNREKNAKGNWIDDPRVLDVPLILQPGHAIRVSIANKGLPAGFLSKKGALVPVTLVNLSVKFWEPKKTATTTTTDDGAVTGGGGGTKEPGLYWSAEGVTVDNSSVAIEHLVAQYLPYEINLLPRTLDPLPDEWARVVGDTRQVRAPGRVYRLSVNRNVRGDALDPVKAAYVLPDEALSLTPRVLTKAATRTLLYKQSKDLEKTDTKDNVLMLYGLRANVYAFVEQFEFTKAAPAEPVHTTIGLPDVHAFADAFLGLGIHCWKLAESVLLPADPLPPVPYYMFMRPNVASARIAPENQPGTKTGTYDLALPSAEAYPIIPRLAEYLHRFGMPVTHALIKARYVLMDRAPFAGLFDEEAKKQAFPHNERNPYAPIEWVRYQYTLTDHRGFVPLDGGKGDAVPQQEKQFIKETAKFKFYALPVGPWLSAMSLFYPLEDDKETYPGDTGVMLRRCSIKTAEDGTNFVVDSLRRATAGNPDLKAIDAEEEFLTTPDVWLMSVEKRELRIPRWTFFAVPVDYVPANPASYVQPSMVPETRVVKREREDDDKTKEPEPKKPRGDDEDKAKEPELKKPHDDDDESGSEEDKMELDPDLRDD